MIGGPASDVCGRRKALIAFAIVYLVFSHMLPWINNYYLYLCIRFIVGGSVHVVFAICTIIVQEVVPTHKRNVAMCISQIGWQIGYATLAMFAYFFRSETSLQVLDFKIKVGKIFGV